MMPFKKYLTLIILLITISKCLSQNLDEQEEIKYIPDHLFLWKEFDKCKYDTLEVIYKKARIDPIIENYTKNAFKDSLQNIFKINESRNFKEIIKIIFIFKEDRSLCINKIGIQNYNSINPQQEIAFDILQQTIQINPAINDGISVNSIGYLYLQIENGRIVKITPKNFKIYSE